MVHEFFRRLEFRVIEWWSDMMVRTHALFIIRNLIQNDHQLRAFQMIYVVLYSTALLYIMVIYD